MRIGGLDVVVAVDKNGGFTRRVKPVGVDERMAGGVDEADVFHADALEFGGEEFGSATAIVFVLGQRGDGRNAEQVFQFIQKAGVILSRERYSGRRHGACSLSTKSTVESIGAWGAVVQWRASGTSLMDLLSMSHAVLRSHFVERL